MTTEGIGLGAFQYGLPLPKTISVTLKYKKRVTAILGGYFNLISI